MSSSHFSLETISIHAPLSRNILKEYNKCIALIETINHSLYSKKFIDKNNEHISIQDLIAYQIGWGQSLIDWYSSGIKGEKPVMPGHGFSTWNYTKIRLHHTNERTVL